MNVRKISEGELERAEQLFYIAFEQKCTPDDHAAQAISREEYYAKEKWAAFDEDQNMMAVLSAIPYEIQFDGNHCKMAGIGGVSCLPQYRRKGAIRGCFQASLNDLYRNGFAFSYLYPFSTGYYEKFGYTLCSEKMIYSIDLRAIKRFDVGGEVCLSEYGSYLQDIKKVYDDFKCNYNLMTVRSDYDYSWVANDCPERDGHYIYVYKNPAGEAKGVIAFTKVKSGASSEMQCTRFCFSDSEGLKGLLNHILLFQPYYERVVFSLPTDINITPYISEWVLYPCSREVCFNGMARVLNVQKVLQLARYRGSGTVAVKISDSLIEQNNACFEVVFSEGKAVNVAVGGKKPDAELDIADFSRCILGGYSSEEVRELQPLKFADPEKIDKIFYKKSSFIADYF